jgi:hypothetical protein
VRGSHCELGWNRQVLGIVADGLRLKTQRWRPEPTLARAATGVADPTRRRAGGAAAA